ncbi:MAG: hypothetical protein ABIR46_02270 [Candidatus Saccharimonadales bacterium]
MEKHYAPPYINDQQVITAKEARKLLGQKSKNLTNEELEALIQATETVVRIFIRTYISSKNLKNNVTITNTEATKL